MFCCDRNNIATGAANGSGTASASDKNNMANLSKGLMENCNDASWIQQNLMLYQNHPCFLSNNTHSSIVQRHQQQAGQIDQLIDNARCSEFNNLCVPPTIGNHVDQLNTDSASIQSASQKNAGSFTDTSCTSAQFYAANNVINNYIGTPVALQYAAASYKTDKYSMRKCSTNNIHPPTEQQSLHWLQHQTNNQPISPSKNSDRNFALFCQSSPVINYDHHHHHRQQHYAQYEPTVASTVYGLIDSEKINNNDLDPRCFRRRLSANKKERRRTQSINNAFAQLRDRIPNVPIDTKLSKIKTLRLATKYIEYLMERLARKDCYPDCQEQRDVISGFKADLGKGKKRAISSTTSCKSGSAMSVKRFKSRTGWPQEVWAQELRPQNIDCKE